MRFEMKMPDLATNDSTVKVLNWLVEVGGSVRRGQAVVDVETDKATMEVEATVNGTLLEKKCQPSAQVGVGEVIAIIEVEKAGEKVTVLPVAPEFEVRNTAVPESPARNKDGRMFARNRAARKPPVQSFGRRTPSGYLRFISLEETNHR